MIFYLCTESNKYPIKSYLKGWGSSLIPKLNLITYEQIIRYKYIPIGTYIFSDIELLTPLQAEKVAEIWQLLSIDKNLRLLNHPIRSMKRYELLRSLYKNGLNKFNIYYIDECKTPKNFPVFMRIVNDHHGSRTSLINTQQELDNAISELNRQGKSKENRVITEFCDTSDERGIFRKYSALIIGDIIIPISVFLGYNWMLKNNNNEKLVSIKKTRNIEESKYVETNPHKSELREIFQLARMNYGRIDYSILNGKIQTWEINTNPSGLSTAETNRHTIVFGMPINEYLSKQVKLAFQELDCPIKHAKLVESPIIFKDVNLSFPITNSQKFKLLCRGLLPYSYKTYPYKLFTRIQIRKLKFLLESSWKKVIN